MRAMYRRVSKRRNLQVMRRTWTRGIANEADLSDMFREVSALSPRQGNELPIGHLEYAWETQVSGRPNAVENF